MGVVVVSGQHASFRVGRGRKVRVEKQSVRAQLREGMSVWFRGMTHAADPSGDLTLYEGARGKAGWMGKCKRNYFQIKQGISFKMSPVLVLGDCWLSENVCLFKASIFLIFFQFST